MFTLKEALSSSLEDLSETCAGPGRHKQGFPEEHYQLLQHATMTRLPHWRSLPSNYKARGNHLGSDHIHLHTPRLKSQITKKKTVFVTLAQSVPIVLAIKKLLTQWIFFSKCLNSSPQDITYLFFAPAHMCAQNALARMRAHTQTHQFSS